MSILTDKLIADCEKDLSKEFCKAEQTALINQEKVLNAFKDCRVSSAHFNGTSGYGYDDVGRDVLARVFARVFHAESAIVSPYFASGTHCIAIALRGILSRGASLLSITGKPYDTLNAFFFGDGINSLRDAGVTCDTVEMKDGKIDLSAVKEKLSAKRYDVVYIQRSGGYAGRAALTCQDISMAARVVKESLQSSVVFVDNCYGEFVEPIEPIDAGADVAVGSLIKNPGGGLAPCGAYIVGSEALLKRISYVFTAPLIGVEVGSYAFGYREFFQGLFLAPHVVLQAVKGAHLFSVALKRSGYTVLECEKRGDIICTVSFPHAKALIKFCQTIQSFSPVDSYVTPTPWDMPGYDNKVIMAAGCFVQGSSIELSCDAPVKPPYNAYIQGGLTYEHCKLVLKKCLEALSVTE